MKYDDIGFHVGDGFPAGLPESHAWTHIGIFAAWAMQNGLHSRALVADDPPFGELVERVRRRETGIADLRDELDGKLVAELLSDEGNAFAGSRYDAYTGLYEERMLEHAVARRSWLERLLNRPITAYHVEPSWETYDLAAPLLDRLYADWAAAR